jgi:PadR family transcriptional regulator PadR
MRRGTETLGQFEQLVLTAVLTLGDAAYGAAIHTSVTELGGGKPVNLGSVYVTLDRLEDKGYLSSKFADPTPERGGRAKRFFRIRSAGERALRESLATARRLSEAIEETGRWQPALTRGAR